MGEGEIGLPPMGEGEIGLPSPVGRGAGGEGVSPSGGKGVLPGKSHVAHSSDQRC